MRISTEVSAEFERAVGLRGTGKIDEAIAAYQRVIQLQPGIAQAHNNLGNLLQDKKQFEAAVACFQQAILLQPDFAEAHTNLGITLQSMKRLDEALVAARRAIELKPDSAAIRSNLGRILHDCHHLDQAVAEFRRAIDLNPRYLHAYNNLSAVLLEKGQHDAAIAVCRQAIEIKPDSAEAHICLGAALGNAARRDQALAAFRRATELNPTLPLAHWNYSLALLSAGDFVNGWREYEWRWKWPGFRSTRYTGPKPLWDGTPLKGKEILLFAEQGLGDTIQFVRYASMIAARGGKVVVQCPESLVPLLAKASGVTRAVAHDQDTGDTRFHVPMMRLPAIFGTDLNSVPANIPYLSTDEARRSSWRDKLANDPASLKIGLAWAGNPEYAKDRDRSMSLKELAPLAQIKRGSFYSLQKGPAATETAAISPDMRLIDWTGDLHDFSDTAALVDNLDLIITVDTAVAHLAGALAKPVWLLLPFNPDWRWMYERLDTPWYPTMRLFRQQSPGDWAGVIDRVRNQLISMKM